MHTPTIILIAAAASAAVAAPVTTIKPTDSTKPANTAIVAPASAGMVDTEGHCMHPPRAAFAALDAAMAAGDAATAAAAAAEIASAVAAAQATTAQAAAHAEEEETQEQYNKKLVKMDKAREHGVVCTVL
ncbi:uncharacterized protein J4E87_007678 [Alternaria ethzedia]|uniref:uncharacterized protein n=1 Tax=Alternaria ethzedia TaxID=181014 RepID=UPI0020C305EA|nr:uncharacterized protein J4E87_007678 [Alternaria ethzedia]KAI4619091.1 hypothetical protein J4E87_007678 [Alternaria ethzedia]